MRLETLTFGSELEVKDSDILIDYTWNYLTIKSLCKKGNTKPAG
jgi:hypothetical protein